MFLQKTVISLLVLCVGVCAADPAVPIKPYKAELDVLPYETDIRWYLEITKEAPPGIKVETDGNEQFFTIKFDIPNECAKLKEYYEQYSDYTDNINMKKIRWARGVCRLVANLAKGAETAEQDFVSNVDFASLSLDLIPYDLHCSGISSREWLELCVKIGNHDPFACIGAECRFPVTYARYIAKFEESSSSYKLNQNFSSVDEESCHLTEGIFRGRITIKDHKIVCDPDQDEDGLSLRYLQFRDVNRDGYMDAVLTIVQRFNVSAAPGTDQFVLTKKGEDMPLELVPDN